MRHAYPRKPCVRIVACVPLLFSPHKLFILTFNEFEQKYRIWLSAPGSINAGTQRVINNVINVFLVDRQTEHGVLKFRIDAESSGVSVEALLLQIYKLDYAPGEIKEGWCENTSLGG